MNQEPFTLYKLIVLYILNQVTFPLSTAQISDLVLEKEYTGFLTLQQAIHELTQAGLVRADSMLNRTLLQLTDEGRKTLSYFENRISHAIRNEIRDYLKEHKLEMRNESSIRGNYYKTTNGEFEVSLEAVDKDVTLVAIRLSVPTEELAVSACGNWQKRNQEIYRYLTSELL